MFPRSLACYSSLVDGVSVSLSPRRSVFTFFPPRKSPLVYQAVAIDHSEQLAARGSRSSARITRHGPLSIGRISPRRTEDGRLSLAETTRERRRATGTQTHTRARVRVVVVDGHGRIVVVRVRACTGHEPPRTASTFHHGGSATDRATAASNLPSAGESSAARRRSCESGGARPRFEIRERKVASNLKLRALRITTDMNRGRENRGYIRGRDRTCEAARRLCELCVKFAAGFGSFATN